MGMYEEIKGTKAEDVVSNVEKNGYAPFMQGLADSMVDRIAEGLDETELEKLLDRPYVELLADGISKMKTSELTALLAIVFESFGVDPMMPLRECAEKKEEE